MESSNRTTDPVSKLGVQPDILLKAVIAAAITGVAVFGLFETNEAGYITVKQSLLTGKISVISEPGIFCQCFDFFMLKGAHHNAIHHAG